MLNEKETVSKIYFEIEKGLQEIRMHRSGKDDNEIIASYMNCIDHRDMEWLSDCVCRMGVLIQILDMLEVSASLRDPVKESLVERFIGIFGE
jgi:hypothetical protein